jgi:hypothetical protein
MARTICWQPLSQPNKGLGRACRVRKYVLNDWLNRKLNRPDFLRSGTLDWPTTGKSLARFPDRAALAKSFRRAKSLRRKTKFASRINPVRRAGLEREEVSLPFFRNSWLSAPILLPQEGRIAIVTDVGSGMRWTQQLHQTSVVAADGKGAWSWSPDAGISLARQVMSALTGPTRRQGDGGYLRCHAPA